jgi:hypothetical protein
VGRLSAGETDEMETMETGLTWCPCRRVQASIDVGLEMGSRTRTRMLVCELR